MRNGSKCKMNRKQPIWLNLFGRELFQFFYPSVAWIQIPEFVIVVQPVSHVWLWVKGNRCPASLRENFATPSTNYLEGLNLGVFPRIIVIPRNKLNFSGPSAWQNKHLIFRLSTLFLTILWLTLLSLNSQGA